LDKTHWISTIAAMLHRIHLNGEDRGSVLDEITSDLGNRRATVFKQLWDIDVVVEHSIRSLERDNGPHT
jgi:hypothetical protein